MQEYQCTIAQAATLLRYLTDAGDPVMLWGPPGVGKSDIVKQHVAEQRIGLVDIRTNVREPVDLRGIPVPDLVTRTTKWLAPDELPQVARDGESGRLFLDEINSGSPQMMAVCFQLVLDGRIADYVLPKKWVVIAAGNRTSDRSAVQRMPTPLRNRFAHIHVQPDVEAWAQWCNVNGIAPELVAFIRFRSELIHVMPKGDENAFPTPRSLARCSKYVRAPKQHRVRLFAAHIGDAVASELDAFIDLYQSLGSLEDIIRNPTHAPVPHEASARYAVSTGLARLATRQNLGAIVTYAERLPRESQILVVHDAVTRDATLKNTAVYGRWSVTNSDLTIQ